MFAKQKTKKPYLPVKPDVLMVNTLTAANVHIEERIKKDHEYNELSENIVPLTEARIDLETRQKFLVMQINFIENLTEEERDDQVLLDKEYSKSYDEALEMLIEEHGIYSKERQGQVIPEELKNEFKKRFPEYEKNPFTQGFDPVAVTKELQKDYKALDDNIQILMEKAEPFIERHLEISQEWGQEQKKLHNSIKTFYDNKLEPLFKACFDHDVEAVKSILKKSSAKANKPDQHGSYPLHIACLVGNIEILKLLLNAHADPNKANRYGYPIHEAVKIKANQNPNKNSVQILNLLKQGNADLLVLGEHGRTALHTASHCGNLEACVWLIENGLLNCINKKETGMQGRTPLHAAANQGHASTVSYLLQQGADPRARNQQEETPLLEAIIQGNFHLIEVFMVSGVVLSQREMLHLTTCVKNPSLLEEYAKHYQQAVESYGEKMKAYQHIVFQPK